MSLNLHAIVSPLIGRVNSFTAATIRQSIGYTVAADGTQVPSYKDTPVSIQIQELSTDELQKIDGLNLQKNNRSVYLNGNWNGVLRASRQGGDILVIRGQEWLVTAILESWPSWSKLAVVQQNRN